MSRRMKGIELSLDDIVPSYNVLEPLSLETPTNSRADHIRQMLKQLTSHVEIATLEVGSHGAFIAENRARVIFETRPERCRGIQSLDGLQVARAEA